MRMTKEAYDEAFFRQYDLCKNAVISHGYHFSEWTLKFKGISRQMFTGKTARKTLSGVPFADTFLADEQDEITKCCKAIFPDRIWEGTVRERLNTANVWFSNDYDNEPGQFVNAADLYTSRSTVGNALADIGAANPAVCLSTFAGRDTYKNSIYSINGIAVNVDYKGSGLSCHNGKARALDILKNEHFGKTMPAPTFLIDTDRLTLVFVFEKPAYVYKHSKGIKFFEWMSKVFADRISYLGGEPVKANGLVLLPEAAVCHGKDKLVRCTAKWIPFEEKIDHRKLSAWLMPLEEKKKECPWYKTQEELKSVKKKIKAAFDPGFRQNNKNILEDLVAIRDYYCKNGISLHNKDLLFIYAVYARKVFGDSAEQAVYSFSDGFSDPMPAHMVASAINCSRAKEYNYKHDTILLTLGITEDTELSLHIFASKRARREYQKNWKREKQEKKDRTKDAVSDMIKKLRLQGKKNVEILKALIKSGFQMSFKTLERHITNLIKAGDITPRTA